MSSHEPLSEPEPAGPGVWLGGELSTPPNAAGIHDRWLPDAQPCYVLTRRGWVVDHMATALLMRSLRSPNGA